MCPLSLLSKTQNFTHHKIYHWKASKTRQLKCSLSKNNLFRYVPISLLKKNTFLFCRLVFDKDYGNWNKKPQPTTTRNNHTETNQPMNTLDVKAEVSNVSECLFIYLDGWIYIISQVHSPLIKHVVAFLNDPYCLLQILFRQVYTSVQGLEPNTTKAT